MKTAIAFVVLLALASVSLEGSARRGSVSLDLGRPSWPIAREASGHWGVVGEAIIRNSGAEPVTIRATTFKVVNRSGRVLLGQTFDTPEALQAVVRVLRPAPGQEPWQPASELAPGEIGVVFLAGVTDPQSRPTRAQVTVRFSRGPAQVAAVPLEVFRPGQRMQWPLRVTGRPWVVLNTPDNHFHWVGSAIPTDHTLFSSQRFAMDILQIDDTGATHPPTAVGKEDYYAWNEEILSAGRGRVVAVLRDRRDLEIGEQPSVTDNPAGNHVVIQHGPRVFSLYGHMQQNSVAVNVGDWVERGQVLGRVGNSGNTTQPHLHMHFTDAWPASANPLESLYLSQGLPARLWGANVLRDGGIFPLRGSMPLEFDLVVRRD